MLKTARVAKLFAWLHIFILLTLVSSIALMIISPVYHLDTANFLGPMFGISLVLMPATFIPMLMTNPTEDYGFLSAIGYALFLPFLDVVGIIFIVKTFMLTKKRIGINHIFSTNGR